ncbi:MAG: hypothetical protein QNK24_09435 [Desulfuromusa sp.]|nr:hypothetical protein [Desulfuromusa sp.]
MKRFLVALAVLLFFGGGVLVLLWFGHSFISYASSQHSLSVDKPEHQSLLLGAQTIFDLQGSGFNQETLVSLFIDVTNSEAIIGSFPLEGIFHASLLHDDFLYLASEEGGLQVLNIKDPQQPQLLKEYLTGRTIIDIYRSGNYLFLTCGKLGISIMQLGQDGFLDHVTDISMDATASMCHLFNGFLFVAAGSSGLLVYDVRQTEQVELVRTIKPGSSVSKLAVSGDFLYLPVAGRQIEIYQLTEPQAPLLVGSLNLSETPYDLVVHRQHLYVATESGVALYSLVNTLQPELLNKWVGFGSAKKLFTGLDHVYVSDSFYGVRILNAEVEVSSGFINLNIDPRTISATANYLFVAGSNKGLLIVDKKALLSRQVMQTIDTPGSAHDLFIKDNWMYVADSRGGVFLQNLDFQKVSLNTISSRRSVAFAVHQEFLFVAQAKMGIEVFDISEPGRPESVAVWPNLRALRLAVVGGYLLLSKGAGGVELIDVSDIQHPISKDVLPAIHVLDIIAEGSLIYIASNKEGLLIYEVTVHEKFKRLSGLLTPFPMNQFDLSVAVQVQNGIAYVANGRSGLLVVDVRKPTEPIILSSISIPGICKQVRVVDNKVFITSHHGGINVVNIEDPERPILLNSIPLPGLSRGLQVIGDLIYVTQKQMGVTVIPVPVAADKVNIISKQQMQVTLLSPKFPGRYSLQISNQRESVVSDGVVQYR